MIEASVAAAAVLAPAVGCELTLHGRKLQTGVARVVSVWAVGYAAAASWLLLEGRAGLVAFAIFWCGAFLLWFGVRSHIESSILLRMVCLLRERPMTDAQLAAEYASRCGESMRLAELHRGGLVIVDEAGTARVTQKGRIVLLVASNLR
jgi:hypothetical protein